MTRMEAPVIEPVQRISIVTLARESFTGVAGALVCGIMIGGFYALGPVYATLMGLDLARTSTFMASAIVAASATLLLSYGVGSVIGPVAMAELDPRNTEFHVVPAAVQMPAERRHAD